MLRCAPFAGAINVSSGFAIATNACFADDIRINHTVASWLRTFDQELREILIVVDRRTPAGRIRELHGPDVGTDDSLESTLDQVRAMDQRIRTVDAPAHDRMRAYTRKWYRWGHPVLCQSGTVIGAFITAIEEAAADVVMKCDCDMIFLDHGFTREAVRRLLADEADLVEPARFGKRGPMDGKVSTRCFMISRSRFVPRFLPMKPERLDPLRRVHRRLHGRPTWLALEQQLELQREHAGLRMAELSRELGCSLHIARRSDFQRARIEQEIRAFEEGLYPAEQERHGWNFKGEYWDGFEPTQRSGS